MFKLIAIVLMALTAGAYAEPKPKPAVIAPLAYNAPLIAATPSAAIYSREYHGNFAAPYVAAAVPPSYVASPYVGAPFAPYVAAPPFAAAAYSAPVLLKK